MSNKSSRDCGKERDKADFLYSVTSQKLDKQLESLSSLDNKANILLVSIGVLSAGYFQLLANSPSFKSYKYLVLIELFCFFMSGYVLFNTFLPKTLNPEKREKWRNDPSPRKLLNTIERYAEKDDAWFKNEASKSISEAYEVNKELIEKKYQKFMRAKLLMFFGALILLIHFVLWLYNIHIGK